MNQQQTFAIGAAASGVAMLAGRLFARSRRHIDFTGRTVLITGGSRGLGLVLARQLAEEGARISLLARDTDELTRALDQLATRGASNLDRVSIVKCDIRSRDQIREAVRSILDERSAIDLLINNAGVIQVGPLEHMTTGDFERAMATHFWAPLHFMQECVPAMRRRGFGRIVNIASVGGRIAVPHLAPYSASKFALVGLSDAVRAELAQYGIRVTTVSPGLMRTGSPINAQMKGRHEAEYTWFAIADAVPGLSVSAERAARQIIDAARYGDPELTVGLFARAGILFGSLAPSAMAELMALATRVLPGPAGAEGDRNQDGRDSKTRWAPSMLTTLSDRAALANNEVG
jgi:NAD(P)-dependent dehydrogenase (short-subunit alcohol dehydrogenase family)